MREQRATAYSIRKRRMYPAGRRRNSILAWIGRLLSAFLHSPRDQTGKAAAFLSRATRTRAILVGLQGVANVPVSVSEKDWSFVPVGVTAAVTKEQEASRRSLIAAASVALNL